MKHMKCVVFLRPTQENIQLLSAELKSPRYGVYYICMSFKNNILYCDKVLIIFSFYLNLYRFLWHHIKGCN